MTPLDVSAMHSQAYDAAQSNDRCRPDGSIEAALLAITALKILKAEGHKIDQFAMTTARRAAAIGLARSIDYRGHDPELNPPISRFMHTYESSIDASLGGYAAKQQDHADRITKERKDKGPPQVGG